MLPEPLNTEFHWSGGGSQEGGVHLGESLHRVYTEESQELFYPEEMADSVAVVQCCEAFQLGWEKTGLFSYLYLTA